MNTPLRVLLVEDSEDDAALLLRELHHGGYDLTSERVDTPEAMNAALDGQIWDIVISDYVMPSFSMDAALAMVQEKGLDLPFVIVSGAIGEEAAVAAMRAGANDYVMKGNIARLVSVVERVLREVEMRHNLKHMGKALRESEQNYRDLFEKSVDGKVILDVENMKVVLANKAALDMFGFDSADDIADVNILDFIPPEDRERDLAIITEDILKGDLRSPIDFKAISKDGEVKFLSSISSIVEWGGKVAVLASFNDVTEHKQAEEALRESERRYRLLADNVTDVISIMDMNLRHVYVSPSITRLRGYSVEEAMAETLEDFLTPDSLKVAMEVIAKEIAIEKMGQKDLSRTLTLELEMNCKDGSTVWTENTVSPLRDPDGQFIGIVGVTRDITERRRSEQARHESEEKLRRFMDSATDFLTVWDSELNLVDLNEAAWKYPLVSLPRGSKKQDVIGKNMLELDPTVKKRGKYDHYLEVIRTGKPFFTQDLVSHPKFGDLYLAVRAFKVGDGLGLITIDITERKRAEESLQQSEKLRALGELAGGVAHDFNNVLAIILGRAQLALEDVKDEKLKKSIQIIEQTVLDAAKMVRRLQGFAGVSRDRVSEVVNPNQLVEVALEMVESRRVELKETRGLTIELSTELNEVAPVTSNAAELREALVNIIFNAMDAMPDGGQITIKSDQVDSFVVLSISDTGTGIPEEIQEKLFDPFFTTKASKGSGLGLSVTHGIITKHGGSIDCDSTIGKGTTFNIRLPVADGVKKESGPECKPPIIKPAAILLVDDDPEVSEIIGLTLKQLGHHVTVVTCGKEALTAFEKDDYRLVITDLGMPEISGLDVAKAVKELKPKTPVMLITGWGVQIDPKEMLEIDGVIEKPFSKDALLTQMGDLLPIKKSVKRG
jgi:PAS domain S-box-containing protein